MEQTQQMSREHLHTWELERTDEDIFDLTARYVGGQGSEGVPMWLSRDDAGKLIRDLQEALEGGK